MTRHRGGSTRDSDSTLLMRGSIVVLAASSLFVVAAILLFFIVSFVAGSSEIEATPTITRGVPLSGVLVGNFEPKATATVGQALTVPTNMPSTNTPAAAASSTPTQSPPTATAEPPIPRPTPTPRRVNELSEEEFIVMPGDVRQRIKEIFVDGHEFGRSPASFSRLGSSIVDTKHFLGRWDEGPYDLGPFDYLELTMDFYGGSFSRLGAAAHRGLNTAAVFNTKWVDRDVCFNDETMVACELRIHNPSILLIFLGTNDLVPGSTFEEQYSELIQYVIDRGVIPVLITKADRFEGRGNRNNNIIRNLAAEFQIPLLDFDQLASTISGRGLGGDEVHMTLFDRYDYTSPDAYLRGYGLLNLSTLMMLDSIRNEIFSVERLEDVPAQ